MNPIHDPAPFQGLSPLERAIGRTVAYADLFDYPLTVPEIHRYLDGLRATPGEVAAALAQGHLLPGRLDSRAGYFFLPGREETVAIRQERARIARRLWPQALGYGRLMARLPFVRMVSVTGSLAMDNAGEQADIDYLIVTEHGRLWLARLLVIGVVRLAAGRGVVLCPNYLVSERALRFPNPNIYTAHELVQMVPLSGRAIYRRIREVNAWSHRFLPNALGPPRDLTGGGRGSLAQRLAELPLRTPLGAWLDRWEMGRKVAKFRQENPAASEARFSRDCCKGHFTGHSQRIMAAYRQREQALVPDVPAVEPGASQPAHSVEKVEKLP